MNTVYYMVGLLDANKGLAVTGGHGYTYDPEVVGKKNVVKNVPTPYGYFVDSDHQNASVVIVDYVNGRAVKYENIHLSFLVHLEKLLSWHKENGGQKLLVASNMPKVTKAFVANKKHESVDAEYHKKVFDLYTSMKDDVIFNFVLYPKGGNGVKFAHNQANIAALLSEIVSRPEMLFDVLGEKEFSNPTIEFNKLVTASRWFFNTGDTSQYYEKTENDRRAYFFGRVEPDKHYYGKATPDVYYSGLFTKEPVMVLDKLYNFCKTVKENPLNHLLAGNLNNIKSKEVARTVDTLPGKFEGNELISPMQIASNETPCLVELLNPPGLAYRIKDKIDELRAIYHYFLNRQDDKYGKTHFVDITNYFFVQDGKKVKISPEFTTNTLKFSIPVNSPHCVKPVPINLSIKYDCPDRNSFNSLLKDKITDIKVFLVLDFSNEAGVSYSTITTTPDFDYVHSNSIANLRVYSLRELGRK